MAEWVVTMSTGRRVDVEAERHEIVADEAGILGHVFTAPAPPDPEMVGYRQEISVRYPQTGVVLVQLRDGHHLKRIWPAI